MVEQWGCTWKAEIKKDLNVHVGMESEMAEDEVYQAQRTEMEQLAAMGVINLADAFFEMEYHDAGGCLLYV